MTLTTSLFLLISLLDVHGVEQHPLQVKQGNKANALFFVTNDCPISNGFSHEIARICADYRKKGVACTLVYVDPHITDRQARLHAAEYGHGDYPRIVDRKRQLVKATGATVTPEAAVIDRAGKVAYLGRIDDSVGALGQPRRRAKSLDLRDALDAVVAGRTVKTARTKALGCYISDLAR